MVERGPVKAGDESSNPSLSAIDCQNGDLARLMGLIDYVYLLIILINKILLNPRQG
jgi:hypothetical protein